MLAKLPETVADIVNRLEIRDVALPDPEGIDERSKSVTDDRRPRIVSDRGELALPFAAPLLAQAARHEARRQPDDCKGPSERRHLSLAPGEQTPAGMCHCDGLVPGF